MTQNAMSNLFNYSRQIAITCTRKKQVIRCFYRGDIIKPNFLAINFLGGSNNSSRRILNEKGAYALYHDRSFSTVPKAPDGINHSKTSDENVEIPRAQTSGQASGQASDQTSTTSSPSQTSPPTSIPSKILQASLQFVPKYGWSIESLSHGANSLGFPSVSHGLFPRGGIDLIDYFLEDSRRKMVSELNNKMDGLRVPQKIRLACETRLNFTKPYIKKWPEALALMAEPKYIPISFKHLAKLVDDMWYLAGDKSSDMNWYTKRGNLAIIYSSTELYMCQDISPDYSGTLQFLDRRLQDIATFGKTINEINIFAEYVSRSFMGILASKGIKEIEKSNK
ncbi:hypothetical protein Glove_208g33 [Diversispora epigaea]|uniref:Ubiquinone biosynthesis protein n=1 Tax=Diversispora epigaea TaxID=1348612 RepID=A0A397IP77_9GLOM|nr:hypothetical protein Glove_208g33 [Diversispora epigaea]